MVCTFGTDGPLLTIIRCAGVEALLREGLGKDVLHLILAVDDEHPLGLRLKGVDPLQQALPVGVARKTGELADFRLHLDGFTEELHVVRTLQQRAAQRVHGLIAHKEDGAFLPPEVVLEVVLITAPEESVHTIAEVAAQLQQYRRNFYGTDLSETHGH